MPKTYTQEELKTTQGIVKTDDGTYLLGMWNGVCPYCPPNLHSIQVMLVATRPKDIDLGPWELLARFRFCVNEDQWAEDEKKVLTHYELGTEAHIIERMEELVKTLELQHVERMMIQATGGEAIAAKMLALSKTSECLNVQMAPKDDKEVEKQNKN